MRKKIAFAGLVWLISACGVKGDPSANEADAVISDGNVRTHRNSNPNISENKQSAEEDLNENKKKQSR